MKEQLKTMKKTSWKKKAKPTPLADMQAVNGNCPGTTLEIVDKFNQLTMVDIKAIAKQKLFGVMEKKCQPTKRIRRIKGYLALDNLQFGVKQGEKSTLYAQATEPGEYGILIEYSVEVNTLGFDQTFYCYQFCVTDFTRRRRNLYPVVRSAVRAWYPDGKWQSPYRYQVGDEFSIVLQSVKAIQPEEIARMHVLLGSIDL